MKLNFQFANQLGTPYTQGNIQFAPHQPSQLLIPVGNRISISDLSASTGSYTLPIESRKNISHFCLSPNGIHLIVAAGEGETRSQLINFARRSLICEFNFPEPVQILRFFPDSKRFLAACGKIVQIWQLPEAGTSEFAPLRLVASWPAHFAPITALDLFCEGDDCWLATAAADLTCKIFNLSHLDEEKSFKKPLAVLSSHSDQIIGCWFLSQTNLISIGKDGSCHFWSKATVSQPLEKEWFLQEKWFFNPQRSIPVSCASLSASANGKTFLLCIAFANSSFSLYELAKETATAQWTHVEIHSLTLTNPNNTQASPSPPPSISTLALSPDGGDWIAVASPGSLVVWEWQSETFILKQQAAPHSTTCLSWSSDGELMATGAFDGKIRIWNVHSGHCFVTLGQEHTGPIKSIKFAPSSSKFILSASLDGTVRAYDLLRYRNFRTFTTPDPVQFVCVDVDFAGELVAASCADSGNIYIWSMATGSLIEVLTGHSGPVPSLCFDPMGHFIVSCSWDGSVKLWDLYASQERLLNTWQVRSEPQCIKYAPNGKEFTVGLLDGDLVSFSPSPSTSYAEIRTIQAKWDLSGGRRLEDRFTAHSSTLSKYPTAISYSPDSEYLAAGSNSRYICLYDLDSGLCVKRVVTTKNDSLDGVLEKLSAKHLNNNIDMDPGSSRALPGAKSGPYSRNTMPEIRTTDLAICPTGRSWAVCSTEGVLIWSLDCEFVFDPMDLDPGITPLSISKLSRQGDHSLALIGALRIGQSSLIEQVISAIPYSNIEVVCGAIPERYLSGLFGFWAGLGEKSVLFSRTIAWMKALMSLGMRKWALNAASGVGVKGVLSGPMRRWMGTLEAVRMDVACRARANVYALGYLLEAPPQHD